MPNLPTSITDLRGFDSSIILITRGQIPRPIGDFPESLTQAMFVGAMLVGGLAVRVDPFMARDEGLFVGQLGASGVSAGLERLPRHIFLNWDVRHKAAD